MKEVGKILAYVAAVLVTGALLAPPLYWAGRWAVETDLIPQLEKFPFSRYFNRAMLIAALGLLWPLFRSLKIKHWTELGLQPNPRRWRDLGLGVLIGGGGLWAVAALTVAAGNFEIKASLPWLKIGGALLTAVAVAIIEETFFRGALFGVLRRKLPWVKALAFLSVFFAILHFLKPHPATKRMFTDVSWLSGFEILPYAFHQFADPTLVAVGFVTLVIVGWILGYVAVKTRSLYLGMGLHGGWVFCLRSFKFATHRAGEPSVWFGRDVITGVVPIVLLLITLGILVAILRKRAEDEPAAIAPAPAQSTP